MLSGSKRFSITGYLNTSYPEGGKIKSRLKTLIKKQSFLLARIGRCLVIYVAWKLLIFCPCSDVIMEWSCFSSSSYGHRALSSVSVLWNCLYLPREHQGPALNGRLAPACQLFSLSSLWQIKCPTFAKWLIEVLYENNTYYLIPLSGRNINIWCSNFMESCIPDY